jgi:hypothetical protein
MARPAHPDARKATRRLIDLVGFAARFLRKAHTCARGSTALAQAQRGELCALTDLYMHAIVTCREWKSQHQSTPTQPASVHEAKVFARVVAESAVCVAEGVS